VEQPPRGRRCAVPAVPPSFTEKRASCLGEHRAYVEAVWHGTAPRSEFFVCFAENQAKCSRRIPRTLAGGSAEVGVVRQPAPFEGAARMAQQFAALLQRRLTAAEYGRVAVASIARHRRATGDERERHAHAGTGSGSSRKCYRVMLCHAAIRSVSVTTRAVVFYT